MENLEKLFKIQCLHPFFTFAGFADLPAAKGRYFAGAGGKRNYRQNGMYNPGVVLSNSLLKEL